jgi:hypothetical protein
MTTAGSPPESDSARLVDEMNRELRNWRIAAVSYGFTYYASRITLIVASAIVAAKENLSGGHGQWLVGWVPLLAVAVAIITALDTWLRPQQKWRGFMEARDSLTDLMIRMENGLPVDDSRKKFDALRKWHRERNVF